MIFPPFSVVSNLFLMQRRSSLPARHTGHRVKPGYLKIAIDIHSPGKAPAAHVSLRESQKGSDVNS
jgi:hypothetical protein